MKKDTQNFISISARDLENIDYKFPENVHMLSEDNFDDAMKNDVFPWIMEKVEEGSFKVKAGKGFLNLKYYYAIPKKATKVFVMIHGFCEFFGKYHEFVKYLYDAGYGFFFYEQRGHGYSDREVKGNSLVHVDSFDDYVSDFETFLSSVVEEKSGNLDKILFAHSMGGAVAALFLEKNTDVFKNVILSSPMLKLKAKASKPVLFALSSYSFIFRKRKSLSVQQHEFTGIPDFANSSTLSEKRFFYQYNMRLSDTHFQTSGGTFGWVLASFKATEKLLENADKIKCNLLIFQAGRDHLVDTYGYTNDILKKVENVSIIRYEDSKHEIFNATTPIRHDFYNRLFTAAAN